MPSTLFRRNARNARHFCCVFGLGLLSAAAAAQIINPPGDITAAAPTSTSIMLTWIDTSTGEEGFRVEQDGLVVLTTGPNATGVTIHNLTPNWEYVFRVAAFKMTDVQWSQKAWALPTLTHEFWPVLSNEYQVGYTYGEYFDQYNNYAHYHWGVDAMRVGDDATGQKIVVAPFSGRFYTTFNIDPDTNLEFQVGAEYITLAHLQNTVMGAGDVGGWVMAGVKIGEVGNRPFGNYGAHTHIDRMTTPFKDSNSPPTDRRHPLLLYTTEALRDPGGGLPTLLDRDQPLALDADDEKIQYRDDGGTEYFADKTPGAAGQPANAFIVKGKVDIVAEAQDAMGHPAKPAALYSIAYWIQPKVCHSHWVRSEGQPYVLHTCETHLWDGGTQKTAEIYETSKQKEWNWQGATDGDTCGHYVVTNTKGTDGSMSNVDKDQYWHTNAKLQVGGAPNGVGYETATKAAEAYFPDGHYQVHIAARDIVRENKFDDDVWVENFPPAVRHTSPKPRGNGPGFASLVVEFSEPMDQTSVENALSFRNLTENRNVPHETAWNAQGYFLFVNALEELDPEHSFEIKINAGVAKDLSGGPNHDGARLDREFGHPAHNGVSEGDPTDSPRWVFLGGDFGGSAYALSDCDSNCDGVLDFFDLDSFIEALLLGESEWLLLHPTCDYYCGNDANLDGAVDFFDIDVFIARLLGG